jgi:short-subunit dehydrogenase
MTTTRFHTRAGGEDEQIPKWFSQSPEQVVAIALRALKHRKRPIVACGPQRPLIFLSRFIPRKWVILLAGHLLEQGLKKRSH